MNALVAGRETPRYYPKKYKKEMQLEYVSISRDAVPSFVLAASFSLSKKCNSNILFRRV
jgi:hypothetical protein